MLPYIQLCASKGNNSIQNRKSIKSSIWTIVLLIASYRMISNIIHVNERCRIKCHSFFWKQSNITNKNHGVHLQSTNREKHNILQWGKVSCTWEEQLWQVKLLLRIPLMGPRKRRCHLSCSLGHSVCIGVIILLLEAQMSAKELIFGA